MIDSAPRGSTFEVVDGDLLRQDVDALVYGTTNTFAPGSPQAQGLFRAAGPELAAACQALGKCPVGEARLTPGFGLGMQAVAHAVAPWWKEGGEHQRAKLASCYRSALEALATAGHRRIAVAPLGSGEKGTPPREEARIAIHELQAFLARHGSGYHLRLVAQGEVLRAFERELKQHPAGRRR